MLFIFYGKRNFIQVLLETGKYHFFFRQTKRVLSYLVCHLSGRPFLDDIHALSTTVARAWKNIGGHRAVKPVLGSAAFDCSG
jgi:hypothetical protein